jgi:hypothetical protein
VAMLLLVTVGYCSFDCVSFSYVIIGLKIFDCMLIFVFKRIVDNEVSDICLQKRTTFHSQVEFVVELGLSLEVLVKSSLHWFQMF